MRATPEKLTQWLIRVALNNPDRIGIWYFGTLPLVFYLKSLANLRLKYPPVLLKDCPGNSAV